MSKLKKQLYSILAISGLNAFQLAGASWIALLAARGFSLVEIGIAESCFHVTSLLFEIPSGVISDVFGRKKSMILSQCMFIMSALLMAFSTNFTSVCLALIFNALGYNFASGAREALTYDSLKQSGYEDRYMEVSAFDLSIYYFGKSSAVLCVGLALAIGYKRAYLLDAFLNIGCLIISLQLTEIRLETGQFEGQIRHRIWTCFKESFNFIIHNGRTIGLMLWNSLVGCIAILTVFFLQARLIACGVSNTLLGPTLFVVALGGVIGPHLITKTNRLSYSVLSAICILGVIFGAVCGAGTLPLMMCIGGFIANLCDNLLQVRTDAILNSRFHSSQRATMNSVVSQTFSILMIFLSPIAGWMFSI